MSDIKNSNDPSPAAQEPNTGRLLEAVPAELAGKRFDVIVAKLFPEYSRARLQTWIKSGKILVDGQQLKPREKLASGMKIVMTVEPEVIVHTEAQSIDLPIVYEDEAVIIINKPKGLVVHPGAGNSDRTLMNGLLHYLPELEQVPRAGIVHRLDKDTTGLMVVAKTLVAHAHLVSELEQRLVKREYLAVCRGVPTAGDTIDKPIGRHPSQRTKMSVLSASSNSAKPATTHFRVVQKFSRHTLIRCKLETGRTHQIRVHMAWKSHPLVGDQVYGGRLQIPKGASEALQTALRGFKRQALHATQLGFMHPEQGKYYQWQIPMPHDMQNLVDELSADKES
ncbi:MAG: 23S rRNA pseudouridine(1911/1915/1917) synthase RluD [Gammaproteobacteria bacterium]|nr:23S rRNA pseudouridine(1911/1915/1917) synthase RluD [Gammaproteobacteria bacterium]NNM14098.1 23S rRNA pseudouridine(1911/1915/1917) synthase RluD [Gammaproteobacteria bacterium]